MPTISGEDRQQEWDQMRVLIITDYLPFPLISGDRIRVYNLTQRIAERNEVSIAAPIRSSDDLASVGHLKTFCHRVETAELSRHHPVKHLPGLLAHALSGRPLELKFLHSRALRRKIQRMAAEEEFDIVQIEHSRMAPYGEALPHNTRSKTILSLHNVTATQFESISRIARRPMGRFRAWLYSRSMIRWEPRVALRFDRCLTVSELDRRSLRRAEPRLEIDVIPNGVDTHRFQLLPRIDRPPSLLFVGTMHYGPCIDAMIYFCDRILPIIQQRIQEIQLWIVGARPPESVRRLANANVHVTGRVADVVPYYRKSSVAVVPLRAGGGTRLKILESMALGRPVVSTSIGCEGLDVQDEEHLFIANSPQKFSERVIQLLTEEMTYERMVASGRKLVEERYDWDPIAEKLLEVYTTIAARPESDDDQPSGEK